MQSSNVDDLDAVLSQMRALEQQMATLQAAVARGQHLSALGILAASVAHELNNVLTPIHGYAKAALARPDDADLVLRALERVMVGIERGTAITRSVLALACATCQRSGASVTSNVASAANEAISLARAELGMARSVATNDVPTTLMVQCDPAVLVQVLYNLVINAARAMSERGGHIALSATRSAVNTDDHPSQNEPQLLNKNQTRFDNTVLIVVSDDGPGIPPAVQTVLFKPLATSAIADVTRARSSGSGLGLSICKGLLEASGGGIAVETVVGGGTTFTITLPEAESVGRAE